MIAVDTDVLLSADREETPQHRSALRAIRRLAEGIEEALSSIESLLASPSVCVLAPGSRYLRLLRNVIEQSGVRGNLVFDAQITAVCLEHGASTLLTEDRDFTRFEGIRSLSLAAFLSK